MAQDFKLYLDSVTAGAFTTSTAGTGDGTVTALLGTGQTVVTTSMPRPAAIKLTQTTGQACGFYKTISSRTSLFLRDYFMLEAPITTSANHVILRVGAGTARGFDLSVIGTGRLRAYNNANGVVAETPVGSLTAGTWYRREVTLTLTSLTINIYTGDSTTPTWTLSSGTVSSGTFGTAFDRITWGNPNSTPVSEVQYIDSILLDTTTTPGALSSSGTLAANVTVIAAAYVDATGSVAGSGGTLSYSIAQTVGTTTAPISVATGKWLIPRSQTETLTYEVTVTESGGVTPKVVTINVTPPAALVGAYTRIRRMVSGALV
jgi:hypothetical protein